MRGPFSTMWEKGLKAKAKGKDIYFCLTTHVRVFFDVARLLLKSLEARQVVIARLLLLRKSADTVHLKIIVSSLNLLNNYPSPFIPLPHGGEGGVVGADF